jgi:hypothetical protein
MNNNTDAPTANDLDSALQTADNWSDYQALELIEKQLNSHLASLSDVERQRYLGLCRGEPGLRNTLANSLQRFRTEFEQQSHDELAGILDRHTGRSLNLHTTYLHTRMLAIPERERDKDPIELLARLTRSRSKRALAADQPYETRVSRSLWQAAKDNFGFDLSSTLMTGLEFQRASYIDSSPDGSHGIIREISVADFIDIVRDFDFANRLRAALAKQMTSVFNTQISAHQKASFELAVLEAKRSQADLNAAALMRALEDPRQGSWQSFSLGFGNRLLSQYGDPDTLPLPFWILHMPQSNQVFSYFPERPGGALRIHASDTEAIASLRSQLRADAKSNSANWLTRTLAVEDQATLVSNLKTVAVNQDELNWLAKQLYQAFGDQGVPSERLDLVRTSGNSRQRGQSLLITLQRHQSQTISRDLLSITTSSASRDWGRVKQALSHIGSEILELLTLPLPGGVIGLNRLMVIASLGSMAYNTVSASAALARGQATEFIQAVGDIAELVISGRIQMLGARLSARRTRQLIQAVGKPRAMTLADGSSALWLSDMASQRHRTGELVTLDTSDLNTTELLQAMLRPDRSALDVKDIHYLQRLTPIARPQLQAIWNGREQPSAALSQAIHELQLRRGLDQLMGDFDNQARQPSELAEQSLAALLVPQLQGALSLLQADRTTVISRHEALLDANQTARPEIKLVQVYPGQYRALSQPETSPLQPLLHATLKEFERLNPGATLGKIGDSPIDQIFSNRLAQLHQQTAQALQENQSSLFAALEGQRTRSEMKAGEPGYLHAPVAGGMPGFIAKTQAKDRVVSALNAMSDPAGRGLGPDTEAIFCSLLTLQPDWPADLAIRVYRGTLDANGDVLKTSTLLNIYGADTARHSVTLTRYADTYAGFDAHHRHMIQIPSGQNSLLGALLQSLDNRQRDQIGYGIHERNRLADTLLHEALSDAALLEELLPAPSTFELPPERLKDFRLALDFSTAQPNAEGLYPYAGKLYVRIKGEAFQVLRDRDASGPLQPVYRVVKAEDPVAQDSDNHYVASRPGRSEAVTRDADGDWVGYIAGGAGGMHRNRRIQQLRDEDQGRRTAALAELNDQREVARLAKVDVQRMEDLLEKATTDESRKDAETQLSLLSLSYLNVLEQTGGLYQRHLESGTFARSPGILSQLKADIKQIMVSQLDHLSSVDERLKRHEPPTDELLKRKESVVRAYCGQVLGEINRRTWLLDKLQAVVERLRAQYAEHEIRAHIDPFVEVPVTLSNLRLLMVNIRTVLLMMDEPANINAPATLYAELRDVSNTFLEAGIAQEHVEGAPSAEQAALLINIQEQITTARARVENMQEFFPNPTDAEHIKKTLQVIEYFERQGAERLEQLYQQITDNNALSREMDAIDLDFLPTAATSTPSATRNTWIKIKERGRYAVKLGRQRTASHEQHIVDIIDPKNEAQAPIQSYEKNNGHWQRLARPVDPGARPSGLTARLKSAQASIEQVEQHLENAARAEKQKDNPTNILEFLESKAEKLDRDLLEIETSGLALPIIGQLKQAILRLRQSGQGMLFRMYKKPEHLDVSRLMYLIDSQQVSAVKVLDRAPRGKGKSKYFLDIYAIKDKQSQADLWHAHFKYENKAAPNEGFMIKGGHLKTLAQSGLGQGRQASDERQGLAHTPIWREAFDTRSAQKLFALAG